MARKSKPASKNVRNTTSGRFTKGSQAKADPSGTVSEPRASAKSARCDNCNGTGLEVLDDSKLCHVCNGSGKVKA